jgi:hypothetical protein
MYNFTIPYRLFRNKNRLSLYLRIFFIALFLQLNVAGNLYADLYGSADHTFCCVNQPLNHGACTIADVTVNVKSELQACNTVIAGILDYQNKNWAIGMTGDTLQPDSFLAFFTARKLAFLYYVRSSDGVSVGDPDAYQKNIDTLHEYMDELIANEKKQVEAQIQELKNYKTNNWAIGLNGDTLQPDGFMPFFAQRELPFFMYVQNESLAVGDSSCYDKNINMLLSYEQGLHK